MSEEKQTTIMPPGVTHDIASYESAILAQHVTSVAVAKARIYDVQAELENANRALAEAQGCLKGVTTAIASAHGMSNAQISPDFKKITSA